MYKENTPVYVLYKNHPYYGRIVKGYRNKTEKGYPVTYYLVALEGKEGNDVEVVEIEDSNVFRHPKHVDYRTEHSVIKRKFNSMYDGICEINNLISGEKENSDNKKEKKVRLTPEERFANIKAQIAYYEESITREFDKCDKYQEFSKLEIPDEINDDKAEFEEIKKAVKEAIHNAELRFSQKKPMVSTVGIRTSLPAVA